MSRNTAIVERLLNGETVSFRPTGNSMVPKIHSRELCTVEPVGDTKLEEGQVVFCKVGGRIFLHLITAIRPDGQVQISNNKGHVNGWTKPANVFGILIKVEK